MRKFDWCGGAGMNGSKLGKLDLFQELRRFCRKGTSLRNIQEQNVEASFNILGKGLRA